MTARVTGMVVAEPLVAKGVAVKAEDLVGEGRVAAEVREMVATVADSEEAAMVVGSAGVAMVVVTEAAVTVEVRVVVVMPMAEAARTGAAARVMEAGGRAAGTGAAARVTVAAATARVTASRRRGTSATQSQG